MAAKAANEQNRAIVVGTQQMMNSTVKNKHLKNLDHFFNIVNCISIKNPFMEPEIIVQSLKSPQALEQSLSMNNKTLVI